MNTQIVKVRVGVFFSGAAKANGWLCIGDHAVGFRYDKTNRDWLPQIFSNPEEPKYIIRRKNTEDTSKKKLEFYKDIGLESRQQRYTFGASTGDGIWHALCQA